MSSRYNPRDGLARRARRNAAMARPELRTADTFARASAASPTSAPIKVQDEETRRLIDDALKRRSSQ